MTLALPIFALIALAALPLVGQSDSSAPTVSGTINGKSIPDRVFNASRKLAIDKFVLMHQREPNGVADEQEIDADMRSTECGGLKGAVTMAAREVEKQQLGIVITQQDLRAARDASPPRDRMAEMAALQGRAKAILAAISAVSDQGQASGQVYEKMLKDQIPKNLWTVYVHDAKTSKGRRSLNETFAKHLAVTPEGVTKVEVSMAPWKPIAENRKLEEAVDQQIAANDPVFRTYLKEFQASLEKSNFKYYSVPTDHKQYMDQKRAEFWKAQASKLDVYLSDPSLAASCGLGDIGVRTANH
jgi:hypothetical protein